MNEYIIDSLKTIFTMQLMIVMTHATFFMAYGYLLGGDVFIALRNFYSLMYNIGW